MAVHTADESELPGAEFVVVANRLPVDRERLPDRSTRWKRSPGGLVTALEPMLCSREGGLNGTRSLRGRLT